MLRVVRSLTAVTRPAPAALAAVPTAANPWNAMGYASKADKQAAPAAAPEKEKRADTPWTLFVRAYLKDEVDRLPDSVHGKARMALAMRNLAVKYNEKYPKEKREADRKLRSQKTEKDKEKARAKAKLGLPSDLRL